jgi:hypothetical protein
VTMTAKSNAQRAIESQARKRASGLVRVCVWAHRDDSAEIHAAMLALAEKLTRKREKGQK